MRVDLEMDARDALHLIEVPTLVLQQPDGTSAFPAALGRYLVDNIRGARCVEVPSLWGTDDAVDAVEEFLTGLPATTGSFQRVLATVLFTDIVGSTERAAELGDRRWAELLAEHHRLVRAELARHRGREIRIEGDGTLSMFDGPARAVSCATAIREAVRPLEVEIRAGLHTGEVELAETGVEGIAVHIGARVAALAQPGEVLVSSTVKDLVVGSQIEFTDRGTHQLKGVPGEWSLYGVVG